MKIYSVAENGKLQSYKLFSTKIEAGFPSPADDYIEGQLDLNEYLVKNPPATFFVRVSGESMIGAGIHPNDLLIVDRSIKPKAGKVVIAVINGEFTVKRLVDRNGSFWLVPENSKFPEKQIKDDEDVLVWGVVTNVIHPL